MNTPKRLFIGILACAGIFVLIGSITGNFTTLAFNGKNAKTDKKSKIESPADSKDVAETANSEVEIISAQDLNYRAANKSKTPPVTNNLLVGTDLGRESEPNGTTATADALTGTEGKIKGALFSEIFATDGTDTDIYSFTTTAANSRIYAATQTSFSASGTDTTLDVLASDGTTVLETDLNDGSISGTSSSISGTLLATPGTYYLRVTNISATAPVAPYDLYFAVRDATPTPEVEPNNNGGTPNPVPASGLISGAINPAADNDTYSIAANAGDTIYLSLDTDPERDNVQWNGRLGLGLFGTPSNLLVVNDASIGSAANPLSEAFFMTVQTTGTYTVYVDEPAGGGAATNTYNLNVTVIPRSALTCTTYTNNTVTPIADAALTSSTITVPGNPIIRRVRVYPNISHTLTADLDVHLVSPANNDNGLFTDITTVATQTVQINNGLDDDAGIPIGVFTVNSGMIYQPELAYRLGWFNGENGGGNWRLDIRDDLATNTGTLNSWALEICEEPAPIGNLIYNQDFENGNGGYTLGPGNIANEWEFGTPNTAATTTANPVAPFLNCASGTNCWKTDLDGTYELSSNQDLTSPNLSLIPYLGPTTLSWQARYQMESVTFDRIWVRVTNVNNPADTRIVWSNENATMASAVGNPAVNIGMSAGWGRYTADISDFAGKLIQVTFHLDSDTSINFGGFAIDDVQIRSLSPVAANAGISGRVTDTKGNGISRARVTLTGANGEPLSAITNSFGFYRFESLEVGQTYVLQTTRKGYAFSPRVVTLQEDVTDADIIAIE